MRPSRAAHDRNKGIAFCLDGTADRNQTTTIADVAQAARNTSSILPRLRDVAAIGNARSKGTLLGVASEQLIVLIAITMKENHLISLSEFRVCWKRESLVSFSGRMTVIRLDKNNCTLELNGRSANIAAKVN